MAKRAAVQTRPAVIYGRQSRTRDGSESLEAQVDTGLETAERHGCHVVATLVEPPSTSAYKDRGRNRPRWAELLTMVRRGEAEVVIIYKSDRASRGGGPGWAPLLEAAEEAGLDLDRFILTPSGYLSEFELGIRATMDREESRKTSDRLRDVAARTAQQGKPNGGGRRPFGYTAGDFAEIVPEEAELIREAAGRVLAGESLRAIAADWNTRGVATSSGGRWQSSTLGTILRGPHLAGLRRHRGKVLPGSWPAILTVDQHEQLVAARGRKHEMKVPRRLLTGLAHCGECGARLRAKTTKRYGLQYCCHACERIHIMGARLEELVEAAVLHRLDSPAARSALANQEDSAAARRIAAKLEEDRAALEQLSRDHYVDRVVSRDVFLAAAGQLEEAIADGEGKLSRRWATAAIDGDTNTIRQRWAEGDLTFRRAVLALLIDRVTIRPVGRASGGRFNPDRIDITWKA